jgi:hypothetical protein
MKQLRTTAILVGLGVYVIAFFMTPLRGLTDPTTHVAPRRVELLGPLILCPDETLFPTWFGGVWQFSLTDRLPVLLGAAAILAWAAAVGWLLLAAIRVDRVLTQLETAVFSTVVGLNALSTWTLLMGLFGRLDRVWTFIVPALLTFVVTACIYYQRRRSGTTGREPTTIGSLPTDDTPSDAISLRWLWFGLPFVLVIFLAAVLPPMDFDVCEYHMQAPKEFFQQGQITFLPHNVYANMALGTEMLSLLGMVLSGDWWWGALIGKTVIATFTPFCALALLAAGRRFFSSTAGVVAALVYISIPWIVSLSSSGLVEGASACYLFLALYALLLSGIATRSWPFIAMSGYLAGGAVATKYPAVLFVLIPLAAWTVIGQFRRGRGAEVSGQKRARAIPQSQSCVPRPPTSHRSALSALTVFLLAAAIGCGLWFAKNWILTDNPTYPLLYQVFGGKTWTPDKEQHWNRVHRPHDFSIAAFGSDLGRVALTSEWISPLVVPLALLAFFPLAAVPRIRWALLIYAVVVIAVWWLCTHRIDRFWIPVLPVLAILAGAGACWRPENWWRQVLECSLIVGLFMNFLVTSAGSGNAWFVPLDQFRNDTQWTTPWHWYLNNDADRGTVLTVGDAAVYDLKSPVLYNTCFDDCIFEQLVKGKTPDEIRAELAARHIAYVFVNWSEIDRYRDTYGFTDFVRPAVFARLVKQGLLVPVQPLPDRHEQLYRVSSKK